MPYKPTLVGAKPSGSEVFLFDYAGLSGKPQTSECDPDLRLMGHDQEGYGLAWSSFKEGYLLSGSQDQKICLWDVSATGTDKVLNAMHVYEGHESVIEDVAWHMKNENIFGSAGDDFQLVIWDLRTNQMQHKVKVHEQRENIFGSAGDDCQLVIWDLRTNQMQHKVKVHEREESKEMYKNQLQELAQRSCFNLPSYTCIREGPDHDPRFKASVNFNGEIFESPTYCSTLRQAEHAAAEVSLNLLTSRVSSKSLTVKILDETGIYKNLLQKTAHS